MELVHTKRELQEAVDKQKNTNHTIGFVPTMGALHKGHLSLINIAGKQSDFVVVSIFVNPTQFNNKEDLNKYPKNLEQDLKLLEKTPCDLVFAPSVNEMYPEEDNRQFDFGNLDTVMEGKHRPGHFKGVAQIVSKLFDAAMPDKAFFGIKDFQQLAVIKNMTNQLKYGIDIVACDTVREPDGLAMSSRNKRLTPQQRKSAPIIARTLNEAKNKAANSSVENTKKWVISTIDNDPHLETEYFEIVDEITLQPVTTWEEGNNNVGCIAVYCGEVRLIDNIKF
ncbi:MAG: pantoate--beta-alanine ligase [Prolixibacteraceae bacterium]|jgi:pantoate--beta-alanine ligase|nr:pantoate--beta-alanine ligase [Prolixibacteraceae bacterium]